MPTKQVKLFGAEAAQDGDRASATITTSEVDRDGDIVVTSGAVTGKFEAHGSVLFGHDARALPVGRPTALHKTKDRIRMEFEWLKGDPFADRVRNAWEQKALNSTSIGFLPFKIEPNKETGGRIFKEWELLEVSIVSIPANPSATRTLKSLGLIGGSGKSLADFDYATLTKNLTQQARRRSELIEVDFGDEDPNEVIDLNKLTNRQYKRLVRDVREALRRD